MGPRYLMALSVTVTSRPCLSPLLMNPRGHRKTAAAGIGGHLKKVNVYSKVLLEPCCMSDDGRNTCMYSHKISINSDTRLLS